MPYHKQHGLWPPLFTMHELKYFLSCFVAAKSSFQVGNRSLRTVQCDKNRLKRRPSYTKHPGAHVFRGIQPIYYRIHTHYPDIWGAFWFGGSLLIWAYFLLFLCFYNRNRFIGGGTESENPNKFRPRYPPSTWYAQKEDLYVITSPVHCVS